VCKGGRLFSLQRQSGRERRERLARALTIVSLSLERERERLDLGLAYPRVAQRTAYYVGLDPGKATERRARVRVWAGINRERQTGMPES